MSPRISRWLALVGLSLGIAGPAAAQARHEFTAVHMGVPVRIVLHASSDSVARQAASAAFARIAVLDGIMSDYRPGSEVRLLSNRPREWQKVSWDLLRVLIVAQEVSRLTGGAFDVTVGPLVQLWRESRQTRRLPDADRLFRARSRVGFRLLEVDATRSSVRLMADSMQIDLGAIAKGYILQEALDVIHEHGIRAAMIDAGGDIVLGDPPPGQGGWSIELTGVDAATAQRIRSLANVAVATSGSTEQFVEIDGVRYSHVVDPRTGFGVTGLHVVTVTSRDGSVADAVATALSVLGPDSPRALYLMKEMSVSRIR